MSATAEPCTPPLPTQRSRLAPSNVQSSPSDPNLTQASTGVADSAASPQSPPPNSSSTSADHQPGKRFRTSGDVYYGHEGRSEMCARFISDLFSCPDVSPESTFANRMTGASKPNPPLAQFIAYAIYRTRLPDVVLFSALLLLARLKERFPAARGSSGHRLFISAFMIASKVVCDDTYSNKSWCIVGQHLFSLKEINQMEREMCSYLEWILHIEARELEAFTQRVKKEYSMDRSVGRTANANYRDEARDAALWGLNVLKGASEASEILAPLKATCAVIIEVMEIARTMRTNKEAWRSLVGMLQEQLENLEGQIQDLKDGPSEDANLIRILLAYKGSLNTVLDCAQKAQKKSESSKFRRLTRARMDRELVDGLIADVDNAYKRFMELMTMHISRQVRSGFSEMKQSFTQLHSQNTNSHTEGQTRPLSSTAPPLSESSSLPQWMRKAKSSTLHKSASALIDILVNADTSQNPDGLKHNWMKEGLEALISMLKQEKHGLGLILNTEDRKKSWIKDFLSMFMKLRKEVDVCVEFLVDITLQAC